RIRRPHPQRCEACRSAGAGTDQVRAGNQSQDRQGAGPRRASDVARPRRRGDRVKRREFITLLGGAAAWPLAARAQQANRVRRIGVLNPFVENDAEARANLTSFRQTLEKLGWSDGRNVASTIAGAAPTRRASVPTRKSW